MISSLNVETHCMTFSWIHVLLRKILSSLFYELFSLVIADFLGVYLFYKRLEQTNEYCL